MFQMLLAKIIQQDLKLVDWSLNTRGMKRGRQTRTRHKPLERLAVLSLLHLATT